jgi:hypothetical protein
MTAAKSPRQEPHPISRVSSNTRRRQLFAAAAAPSSFSGGGEPRRRAERSFGRTQERDSKPGRPAAACPQPLHGVNGAVLERWRERMVDRTGIYTCFRLHSDEHFVSWAEGGCLTSGRARNRNRQPHLSWTTPPCESMSHRREFRPRRRSAAEDSRNTGRSHTTSTRELAAMLVPKKCPLPNSTGD